MEMKMNIKDAKKAAERGRHPMKALHRWGVRSDHAYLAGFAAAGLALVGSAFGGRRDEDAVHRAGSGWGGFFGHAAPPAPAGRARPQARGVSGAPPPIGGAAGSAPRSAPPSA